MHAATAIGRIIPSVVPTAALAAALTLAAPAVRADEGMWTYDHLPLAALRQRGFAPGPAWMEGARRASLRLAGGCSGSFVSENGLVLTNHHCARACLGQLASKDHDYGSAGFYATSLEQEARCPEIELNELLSIADVTTRVEKAASGSKPGSPGHNAAVKAEKTAIEAECSGGDERLRCEVIDLYRGGVRSLYKFHRYQDVRLVFAPEQAAAHFGGDPDNFDFPRFALDATFLRAWEDGKPVRPEQFLRWSADGAQEGELVFVSGNPGSTRRLLTASELAFQRDVEVPDRLIALAEWRGEITQFIRDAPERARMARTDLLSIENSYKALRGRLDALLRPEVLAQRRTEEAKLRAKVRGRPVLQRDAGGAWEKLEGALALWGARRREYQAIEGPGGRGVELPGAFGNSRLARIARLLVRGTAELARPEAERLPEFADARLPAIKQALFSKAPIDDELERLKLTHGLIKLREELGSAHPLVQKVLGVRSPEELAAELLAGSQLRDPALRKQLWEGGPAAVAASKDPLLALLLAVDADGRALRKWHDDEVEAPSEAAHSAIARARFALEGTGSYPDATFTPRLSYGSVRGWKQGTRTIAPFTDFAGAFAHHTGRDPFSLPASWLAAKARLPLQTPLDFVTDNDIIGGNSGSPVFNQRLEVVGVVFDGNLPSLGGDYFWDGTSNRTVAVHSAGLLAALRHIYGAQRVLQELAPGGAAAGGK